jgi:hypothetical protein
MLREGAVKLAAFHALQKNRPPKVVPIKRPKRIIAQRTD